MENVIYFLDDVKPTTLKAKTVQNPRISKKKNFSICYKDGRATKHVNIQASNKQEAKEIFTNSYNYVGYIKLIFEIVKRGKVQ